MMRTIRGIGLAAVLLLGSSVKAGELDAEFGPKRDAEAGNVAVANSVATAGGTEMDAEAPVGAWHHGFGGRGFGFGGFGRGFGGRGFGFGGFGRGFGGFGFGRGFGFGGYGLGGYGLGLGYGGMGYGGMGYGGMGYGGMGYGGMGYGLGGYGMGGFYGGYSSIAYYSPFMGYGYGCW